MDKNVHNNKYIVFIGFSASLHMQFYDVHSLVFLSFS